MPCYSPLDCWRQRGNDVGVSKISFSKHDDLATPLTIPCGQCIGCRLEKSRRWAVRIMHETELHEKNCFLTLTYSDDKLPSDGSLHVEDFQLFMKRLRKRSTSPLRFFHCGEYGEENLRPHYHVCLFGDDFSDDRIFNKTTKQGDTLYTSPRLSEVWDLGHSWIGDLTFESAAYVARYCLKKQTGSDDYRKSKNLLTLEEHYYGRKPEYVTMSRRPGIGSDWLNSGRNLFETYRDDSVVMRGKEMMPPPYYDKLLEKVDPVLFKKVKKERVLAQDLNSFETTSRRLLDRGVVKQKTIVSTLKRSL